MIPIDLSSSTSIRRKKKKKKKLKKTENRARPDRFQSPKYLIDYWMNFRFLREPNWSILVGSRLLIGGFH
ncbi:unnamed protein product, partial [Vitis vinifera]